MDRDFTNDLTGRYTLDNGKMERSMDKGTLIGPAGRSTLDNT